MEKELPLLTSLFPNLNLTYISEKHTDNHLHINLTKNNKNCKGNNLANLPTNSLNNKNFTHINNDKLYNCHDNTQEKRVRSVVRISRRSSEPIIETVPQTVNYQAKIEQQLSHQQSSPRIQNELEIDWEGYKKYLFNLNKSKKEIQNKLGYGKTYAYILETGDAQNLLKSSNGCRVHAMRALSTLSKYIGCYEEWMKIVKKYQLKWKNENYNSLNTFKNIFGIEEGNKQSLSYMLEWVKSSISELPKEIASILNFNTLTGLRPEESHKAIYLLKTRQKRYLDDDKMLLLHYRYPSTFSRATKRCYISIVTDSILNLVKDIPLRQSYYYTVRRGFEQIGKRMNMYYCRKVFATYLRNKGIEPEIIDLLQGRISGSVFVIHYYRPDINEIITKRIRPVLDALMAELKY
ncbi:MAG TPA: integrase [Candidatus Nitrosocosmicus sp.]|nr:integrase [Candidatus Nitrosocosmicus sp.]